MSAVEQEGEIMQYVPFMSFVNPSFWQTLTELKLDIDRLNETIKCIFGRYTYRNNIGAVLEVDGTSFNKVPENEQLYINIKGTIMNKNTIEDFKSIDKAAFLNIVGRDHWDNVKTSWIHEPGTLLNFIILSFADLKKFHYYYWFAFPCPSQPTLYLKSNHGMPEHFNKNQIEKLSQDFVNLDRNQKYLFVVQKENENITLMTISDFAKCYNSDLTLEDVFLAFADPNSSENPGWPLRLYMAAVLHHIPSLIGLDIRVIGVRCNLYGSVECSRVYTLTIPKDIQSLESAGWVGWERNDKGNFGPKLANMSASMDPVKLADTSSDLNLRLMKWRLVPDLDVKVMRSTKCLLLGAGTLGCHVARDLLAWGFRDITFIDNGKVSFSNPTRQVLFNYQDCLGGGKKKAQAAADNLKLILPTVNSKGLALHIPMPGHPVGESLKEETIANIQTITETIKEHDVIFLLLDTREARWLPTLIAAHYGKIVINAALGFDSYLVIRHGLGLCEPAASTPVNTEAPSVPGGQLGCYFCNDVTAPGNSLKDRTLDQQCTVTRPGVAAIAGALAVEVLVAILQHPLRAEAPAAYNFADTESLPEDVQSVLGPIPHSIRGFLHSYQTVVPTCTKFKQCIACSDVVVKKYREEGLEFVINVLNSGTYLEEITGLAELHLAAEMTNIMTLSDDDEE